MPDLNVDPNASIPVMVAPNNDNVPPVTPAQRTGLVAPVAGQAPSASGSEPTVPVVIDPIDVGKTTRLEQRLASQRSLLNELGVDPDSEIVQRFNNGTATRRELLTAAGIIPGQGSEPSIAPVAQPSGPVDIIDRIKTLQQRASTDGASSEDFAELASLMGEAISSVRQEKTHEHHITNLQQCTSVVEKTILQDPMFNALPEDIKAIEGQIFLASADNMLLRDAQKSKDPASCINPGAYQHYSNKMLSNLQTLRDYYVKVGMERQRTLQNPAPGGGNQISVPLSSGSGGSPMPRPVPKITASNYKQAALNYVQSMGNVTPGR